ncbi:MAG: class I SAM-dependent methyltransferase [Acidimicrobiia bacterium]
MSKTSRRAIQGYYDDYSTWYEGERRDGYYGVVNDLEFGVIAEAVTGADALEIGCGTGLILERTQRVARSATGIDLSLGMVGESRRKGLDALQASATALPFDEDSFDVVYSVKVLPHVPEIEDALAEVARVLRPGGRAFLGFYSPWSFKALTYRVRTWMRGHEPVYVRHDTPEDVGGYLPPGWSIKSLHGVRILAATRHFYEWPGIGRLVAWLDRRLRDTWFARFGGYLLVEAGPDG